MIDDIVPTLAAISWNPEIRNILSLLVGFVVLCGSAYLILATNIGSRVGFLVAMACLFGWMTTMGIAWWLYGIGMKGEQASCEVIEINTGDRRQAGVAEARSLPHPDDLPDPEEVLAGDSDLDDLFPAPEPGQPVAVPSLGALIEADPSLREELNIEAQLGDWELLIPSDPQRGDAQATADASLGPDGEAIFEESTGYKVLDAYSLGGKPRLEEGANRWERIEHKLLSMWHWSHPTHYAVVQVQGAVPQETEPGEAPPPLEIEPEAPVVSVIMERNLGDLRFPAAMVTIVFGILFALSCNALHRRDKLAAGNRAAAG
ncbi:hypothetical protein BH18ACT4_BH18ACT4_03400 [soil metagenome]